MWLQQRVWELREMRPARHSTTTEAFRGAVRSLGSVLQAKLHFGKITIPASRGGKGG